MIRSVGRLKRQNTRMLNELADRCNAVEESYEFMLAYAAQGVGSEDASVRGSQIRDVLGRAVKALTGLGDAYASAVKQEGLASPERYLAFLTVLDRDARDSL